MRFLGRPALVAALLASFALLLLINSGRGADEEKELREGLVKLAAAIEKKDDEAAKKLVSDLAKKFDMEAIMFMHAERSKGGVGVGSKPDEAKPDGIEKKVVALAKKPLPPDQLSSEADALAQMGYRMAALADLTLARAPQKDEAAKKRKDWLDWAAGYRAASLSLVEAAQAKKPDLVHQAAKKADATCTRCHDTFK
jgi:hypothetical protein